MLAIIKYMKNDDKKKFLPFYDKIPEKIKYLILKKYKTFLISNSKILNNEILYITIPLNYNEKKENYLKWYNILSHTIEKLNINNNLNINAIILPDDDIFYSAIPIFRGKFINSLLSFEIAKKISKIQNLDISKLEFLIVDGEDILTLSVIKSLIGNVNYISILTDRIDFFNDIKEFAEEEYGLIINTFSNSKNQILKNSDIIMNCSNNNEHYSYYYKRNSIYIDICKNKNKSSKIYQKRDDMTFIDGFVIKKDNIFIKSQIFEGLNYINDRKFKRYIDFGNDIEFTIGNLRKDNLNISSLYFNDKPIIKLN